MLSIGPSNDRADTEDGRPLSLANRRPSLSAASRKASGGSRIHTPPPSPADMLADGASSTPKRLVDGKLLNNIVEILLYLTYLFLWNYLRKWQYHT